MNPILFSESSTEFNTNGLGRLTDAISCKVKEQRNGEYTLTMVYPTTGAHFGDIGLRKIIYAKPSQAGTNQPFRIASISRPIKGKVTIVANHLSYDLTKYVSYPAHVTASASACQTALNLLRSSAAPACPFSFETDVTTVASYDQNVPASLRQRLGGVEGSILDQFGGEYEWDGYTVRLLRSRGSETNYSIKYGKNLIDLKQEENISNTATGVVPFWSDVEGNDVIYGAPVYAPNYQEYSVPLIIPLDLSEEWDEKPTPAQLETLATVFVNKEGFGIPKVSIQVSFVNLADTEEFKDILALQNVSLCDTVKVKFPELGVDTTAKIVETNYDVIREKYDSIQIGTLKSTLAGVITDYEASMVQTVSDTGKRVFAEANTEAQDLVNNATAWLTSSGGYVIAVKNQDGSWKELLFMDTNDVATARNVLRINENGIGFSSTGVGGPYTQAWTLDGKLVVGGTNVPSITCYDSNNRIVFQASASGATFNSGVITLRDANDNLIFKASSAGVVWNATNSSMDQSGKLTIKNADITDGTVKLGGTNNGILEIYNSGSKKIGEWTRDHLLYTVPDRTDRRIELTQSLGEAVIRFDNGNAVINGSETGLGRGLALRSRAIALSTGRIYVTRSEGSTTVFTGLTGDVITSLGYDSLSGICCNLSGDGAGGFSWDIVDIEYISSYSSHGVVNGIVVE